MVDFGVVLIRVLLVVVNTLYFVLIKQTHDNTHRDILGTNEDNRANLYF